MLPHAGPSTGDKARDSISDVRFVKYVTDHTSVAKIMRKKARNVKYVWK